MKERFQFLSRLFYNHDFLVLIKLIQFGEINTPFPFCCMCTSGGRGTEYERLGHGCREQKDGSGKETVSVSTNPSVSSTNQQNTRSWQRDCILLSGLLKVRTIWNHIQHTLII